MPVTSALLRELEAFFVSRTRPAPIKLPEFASTELPDPGRFRRCLIDVSDKGCAAYSNGVAWVRADGSPL